MTSQLLLMEGKLEKPTETTRLTASNWQLSHMPRVGFIEVLAKRDMCLNLLTIAQSVPSDVATIVAALGMLYMRASSPKLPPLS